MVALMTGVKALGKSASRTGRPAARRSISSCSATRRCSAARRQANKTMFGSLQLAADTRSDRDEVAPRVMSYRAPIAGRTDSCRRASRFTPRRSRSTSSTACSAAPCRPGPIRAHPGAEAVGLRLHEARHRAHADADSGTEKDRLATHLSPSRAGGEPAADVRHGPHTALHEAGDAADVREHQHRADDFIDRVHDRVGRRLLRVRRAQQPPPPGPRPQSAPADQDGVRLRPGSRRDVHVVLGDQLGRVSRHLPGRDDQRAIHSRRRTTRPATAIRRGHRDPRLAEPDQPVLFGRDGEALQEFATTPDIDGNMLIDNTVVVYVTEVARAWDHNQQNMPLIVFGGKNTRVRGGTYLKVTGGTWPRRPAARGQPAVQRHVAGAAADLRRQQHCFVGRRRRVAVDGSAARDLFLGPGAAFPVV